MMQRRTIFSSLLLVSLLSTFAFTSALAQNSVTVENRASLRCVSGVTNVTVDISQNIAGLEIVLDYSGDGTVTGFTFDASFANLASTRGFDVTTNPGTIRIWALDNTGNTDCLIAGTGVLVGQLQFTTDDVCEGSIVIEEGSFACNTDPQCLDCSPVTASSQVVECSASPAVLAATVTAGTVTISNAAPSITDCPGKVTMPWSGPSVQVTVVADDADLANSCGTESLSYSLDAASPGYASINASGVVTLSPQGNDVCEATVTAWVKDQCNDSVSCSFDVCVTNEPPVATCPTDTNLIIWGNTATGQATAVDPDNGPLSPPSWSVNSFTGPGGVGAVTVDNNGVYTWNTQEDPSYIGIWKLCLTASDGANTCVGCSPENSDTCCLYIQVIPTTRVTIEKRHMVIQGGHESVEITIDDSYENYPVAGFDLLIEYDPSALALTGVDEGGFITGNEWEYFTWRFGPYGNCGSGCPSGKVRIVALAETNDGAQNPSGYTNTNAGSSVLAILDFLVSDDRTLECQYAPVKFCWYDCGDNTFSSVTGDSLFMSRYVYELEGVMGDGGATSIHGLDQDFPTLTGAPDVCDVSGGPDKPAPIRIIDFKNGGIDIACADSIDDRGDVNLNGISNEIADAVVFTNYFVQGLSAFNTNIDGQTAATEINGDGVPLTVADLVYLIRIIVGDALPLAKLVHNASTVTITTKGDIVSSDVEMGAVEFVFKGETEVTLLAANMDMSVGVRDGNTHVLVYNIGSNSIAAGEVISANAELLSIDASDYYGNMLSSATKIVPVNFALSQNYPNPFNPKTNINIDLPVSTDFTLAIYNISGQKVHEINRFGEAGTITVEWEAGSYASGIYFYKLTAGNFTATKKMALLK